MKRFYLSLLTVALTSIFSTDCFAGVISGFQGPYAPTEWVLNQGVGDGSVDTSGAPSSISISSSDTGSGDSIDTDFTVQVAGSGIVSFDWSYLTTDIAVGGPFFDPFGYLLNGTFVQLTDDGGLEAQSGFASVAVSTDDIFGFRANALDDIEGSATTIISNFRAPGSSSATVPEPMSMAVCGIFCAMGTLGGRRRRSARGSA